MKTKIKPLFGRVLIKKVIEEENTSGIIIPKDTEKQKGIGEVIAVAPDVTEIKEGQTVIFPYYLPDEVDERDDLFIISEDNILGIYEK